MPESRDQPGGDTIRLAAAILKSESPAPKPDPIVYLEGGPGGGAIANLDLWVNKRFETERDFILLDQRGTGYSEPNLSCPELDETDVFDQNLSDEEELAHLTEIARTCRDRLVDAGANLAAYNSAENAADLNDLRLALGYEAWNLYGISYGTRLALTAMRDYPQGIRSAILDSVYPPDTGFYTEQAGNAARAFDLFFNACAGDATCEATYPNLETIFYDLVARTNEEPVKTSVFDFSTGERVPLWLEGDDLINILFQALYDRSITSYLPFTIYQAYQGNYNSFATLAAALDVEDSFSFGMYYAVQCHEEVPFNDPATVEASMKAQPQLGDITDFDATLAICGVWRAGQAGDIENQPVKSDIPTLLLSGQYDPITPPAWGARAAETLSRSYHFEFPGVGHGASVSDECAANIAAEFVNNPTARPDSSCIAQLDTPSFITALHPSSIFYNLTAIFLDELNMMQAGLLGACILIFLSAAFVWPLALLLYYLITKEVPHRRASLLAASLPLLNGALNLALLVGLAVVLVLTVVEDEAMFIFGAPTWAAPLFVVPFISLLFAVALLVVLIPVWKGRYWFLLGRLHYTVISLATLIFVGLLGFWGLL